jgi:hypothetical protein
LPSSWQGWLALAIYLALLAAGVFTFPRTAALPFFAYSLVLVLLFNWVCWLKGEPLRWGKTHPPKD